MNRYFGTHTLEGEWHSLLPRYLLLGDRVAGSRVLDIGCGTGIGSSLLLELGAESVDGVDHRPEVLELARMKHDKQGLDFHVMFWEELDFQDDSFDVVVCLDPASPITDPNLLREVRRVLRDGGEYVCALERTTIAGLESVLPRYGYTSSADEVSIAQDSERVPQIGVLTSHFETIVSLVQRPHISFVFEPEADDADADETAGMRRVPDAEGGLWATSEADDTSGPTSPGKWIPVDHHLSSEDAEAAAVEIFFCGDAHLPPPALREVRLPYYNIVGRLEQLVNDLQMRQNIGGEPSSFEEVLDEPSSSVIDEEQAQPEASGDFDWDHTPTQVLDRSVTADLSAQQPSQVAEMESQTTDLTGLYRKVRRDFDKVLRQTEAALNERDEYIDHLVRTVHEWEARFGDEPDNAFSDTATTSVFKMADAGPADSDDSLLDELSEIDAQAGSQDIADEIASLEQDQERIQQMLAAREARLDELKARLDNADDGDDEQADDDGEAADDSESDAQPSDGEESDAQVDADDAQEADEPSAVEETSEADEDADADAEVEGEADETTK